VVVNRTPVGVGAVVTTGDDGVVGRRVAAVVDVSRGETKTSVADDRVAFAGGRSNKLLFGRCIHCIFREYFSSMASRIFRISPPLFYRASEPPNFDFINTFRSCNTSRRDDWFDCLAASEPKL